jgi:hypothetical protein
MRKIYLGMLSLLAFFCTHAQSYAVQWGDEMKLKKGSIDFDVVNADETGVYVLEGKMKSHFSLVGKYSSTYKLIKFDRNYNDIYQQEFKNQLKGLNFKSIQFLQKDMYLFADDYIKKDKQYIVYGVKVDRNTGEPLGAMKELASFQLDSKRDNFDYSLTPTPDSSRWMLIGDVSTEANSAIYVTLLDRQLNKKSSTPINLSFEPKTFTLEDVLPTQDGKFLVMGKRFDLVPTGKKNKTVRTFTKYIFTRYDSKGKKEMDLPTDVGSHYATSGRAIFSPDGALAIAGFYSNDPRKKEVNGVYLHKIDVTTGTVLQSSYKEISADMLDQAQEDENDLDEDQKKERKEKEKAKDRDGDDDGISKNFIIRGVEYNPSNGSMLLIAELSTFSSYTRSYYNSSTRSWTYRTYYVFTNSDMMVINANNAGQIEWINTLPKKQIETIEGGAYGGAGISFYNDPTGFFAQGGGMPFYSSFSYMLHDNKLIFLINDHVQNIEVKKLGDKVKTVNNFRKSVAYAVTLDLKSGQFSRKVILSNEDDPVLMPRFSYVVGKDFYLPAMKMKAIGKTEFKIGKITVRS